LDNKTIKRFDSTRVYPKRKKKWNMEGLDMDINVKDLENEFLPNGRKQ